MDIREKLVEVLECITGCAVEECRDCALNKNIEQCVEFRKKWLADKLLANGVTINEWIPVTERLPDGECLAVSMLKYQPSYKEMLVGYVAKDARYETGYCCESDDVILPNVTHWTEKTYPAEGGADDVSS